MVKSVSNSDTIQQTIDLSNEKKLLLYSVSARCRLLCIWIIQNYAKRLHACVSKIEKVTWHHVLVSYIFSYHYLYILNEKISCLPEFFFFIANSNFAFSLGHPIAISTCNNFWTPCELKNHTYHWQVFISFSLVKGILHKERKIQRFNWNNLYQLRIDTVLYMTGILGLRIWINEF